jgi:hypothetical protein
MSSSRELMPVFLHGMWRTGSTYFWHKFRKLENTRAFLEPLHECLLNLTEQQLRDVLPLEITASMRHPSIDQYYFEEYTFRADGGVPNFKKHFSYQRYCLDPDENEPELERYVLSLLQLAWDRGQRPILQFNRGLMRAGWLAKRFDAINVVLLRNPSDTWKSFLSYDNLYFPTVVCMIMGQNPELRSLAEAHQVPSFVAETVAEELTHYRAFVESRLNSLYQAFFEFNVVANLEAVKYADIVVDVNQIAVDSAARAFITDALQARQIVVSLDDCSIPVYERPVLESQPENPRPKLDHARLATFAPGLSFYWRTMFQKFC